MYKYIFLGKIHPERVNFTVGFDLPFILDHKDFEMNGVSSVKIENYSIIVSLESTNNYAKNDKCNLETLKNLIEENVRLVVDSYCFVKSYSYDVEITKVICNDLNIDITFGVLGEWNIEKNTDETNKEFTKILKLFDRPERMFLKDVLADFRRAIKYPSMTASFCFRAIETIRKFYFEDIADINDKRRRKNGWKKLNKELNYKEDDFVEITHCALPNRHGDYPAITYEVREKIMNFTRNVVDRLLDRM